jgi:hypothetical protein
MIKAALVVAGLALFVAACSDEIEPDLEVHQGAVTSPLSQAIFAPAYFGTAVNAANNYSWSYIQAYNDVDNDSQTVYYAIVNQNSGPGAGFDQNLQNRITQYLTTQMIQVFGYVNYDDTRPFQDVVTDVTHWKSYGYQGLTGIFFDLADRTTTSATEVGRAEYLAQLVKQTFLDQYSQNGSVFNWGSTNANMEPYVNCGGTPGQGAARNTRVWFVTEEMSQSTFLSSAVPDNVGTTGDTNYRWLVNYNPTHFINLVHGVNTNAGTVQTILDKARRLNAVNVYLTDRLDPNDGTEFGLTEPAGLDPTTGMPFTSRPWNPLAGYNVNPGGSTVWSAQNLAVGGRVYSDFPGSNSDSPPRTTCPAQVSF